MTIMALDVQKNYLTLEKSDLEYEMEVCSSQKSTVSNGLTTLATQHSNDSSFDMDTNPQALVLEQLQKMYDTQSSSIDSQLKAINSQIESFQKTIDNNVKTECKLSISV